MYNVQEMCCCCCFVVVVVVVVVVVTRCCCLEHTHTHTHRSSAVPSGGGRCSAPPPLRVDVVVDRGGGERAAFSVALQPCCRLAAASQVRSSAPRCPECRANVPSVEQAPAPSGRSVEGHGLLPTSLGVRRSVVAGGASESSGASESEGRLLAAGACSCSSSEGRACWVLCGSFGRVLFLEAFVRV